MSTQTPRTRRRSGLAPLVLLATLVAGCFGAPQQADWGLGRINDMKTPPDDPSLACGVQLPADTLAAKRKACSFDTGALPETTLGIPAATAAKIPIRHLIIVMKENRSFDHLLGALHDEGQPDTDAIPADFTNDDLSGKAVHFTHSTNTCIDQDPGHQSQGMSASVDGGKMDGFVKNAARTTPTDGHFVMTYYQDTELPFDYWLAKTWALADRHFAPVVSGTFANRTYMMFGQNYGVVDTGIVYPRPNTPSIFQLLMNAGYTWGAYSDGGPLSDTLGWTAKDPGVHSMADLYKALDNGTLPNVAFVDGTEYITDDHPDADLQKGEVWLKQIYDHVVASPQWDRLAMIWTYDEGGGFADHVKPPNACRATPDSPYTMMGPRVPLVVISPWAKRHFVSHVASDHTAITRLVELLFHLPAMTARDANSTALLNLFDFSCGRNQSVPPAPDPGTGDCTTPTPPGTH